jgi:hypothetical protein
MINLINKNNKLSENKNSLVVTYPRTVHILFGNYPYPEKIHNFILEIKNNLSEKMEGYTNVKGGMTSWDHFIDKPSYKDFISYVINKHQISHPNIFEHFFEKYILREAWGNEIKNNDSLDYHYHHYIHGILYLTKGCDLNIPELNIRITPEPGDYYILPPYIHHGFEKHNGENNRYCLVFNLHNNPMSHFSYNKKIEKLEKIK